MKYYTGIGSRETPAHILNLMGFIGEYLYYCNYVLRSGGADGADTAFEEGAKRGRHNTIIATQNPYSSFHYVDRIKIYLPWHNFNNRVVNDLSYINASKLTNWDKASEIASRIHPVFNSLSRGAKALHTRNVYQVLGDDLNTPSHFIICYTDPLYKTGGTRTAVKIGLEHNINIWNLAIPEVTERVMALKAWVNWS